MFFVLVDGQEYSFDDTRTLESRKITLDVVPYMETIEIIGTCAVNSNNVVLEQKDIMINTKPVTTSTVLPVWIKVIFTAYGGGKLSEPELLEAVKYLVNNNIITLDISYQIQHLTKELEQKDMEIQSLKQKLYDIQSSKKSYQEQKQNTRCDSSYPDVCIPPYPPDLNCRDVHYKNFKVVQPDPHGFDRDRDGIGCER